MMELGGFIFFMLFSVLASPGRFFALFLREYGLSDSQVGFVASAGYLIAALSAPKLNSMADNLGERELVCAGTYSASIALYLLQAITVILPNGYKFFYLLVVSMARFAVEYPGYPLVCALSIANLKQKYGHDAHTRFGRDRLWGAVSWALVSVVFGAISDSMGGVRLPTYFGRSFFAFLLVLTLIIIRIRRTHNLYPHLNDGTETEIDHDDEITEDDTEKDEDGDEIEESNGNGKKKLSFGVVIRLLTDGGPATMVFYVLVFVLRSGMSIVEGLLFLYFNKQLRATNFQCGLTVVVTVIFEIPLFASAPWLLRKLGAGHLLSIGAIAYAIRGIGYSVVPNAWWVLLLEPLHGVTFAAMHTAAVAFVAQRIPPHLEATAQSMLSALENTACVVATATGGWVMQKFGPRIMYASAGTLVLITTTFFVIIDRRFASNVDTGYNRTGNDEIDDLLHEVEEQ